MSEQIPDQLRSIIVEIMTPAGGEPRLNPGDIADKSHLRDDLGLDDLDFMDMIMSIEEELVIELNEIHFYKLTTFGALVEYVSGVAGAGAH